MTDAVVTPSIPAFDRRFFASTELCTRIGTGALGGKAHGLLRARDVIADLALDPELGVTVTIPRMIVVATSVFDTFLERNQLHDVAQSNLPDERIAHAFQQAPFPTEVLGDLRALVEEVHTPLAVRSSSMLEDAMRRPFAGVYETKMIPNNEPDATTRFQRLVEAIKFVYASTFFRAAKQYLQAAGGHEEKMAVLIQEVVGRRHNGRFYPTVSGVAKSFNFYPTGAAHAEDGVVNLALGLGKTIVDGGRCWVYAPSRPQAAPPYGSVRELVDSSQAEFWAVNMAGPPAFDPVAETEYLVHGSLADAEYDGALRFVASTYDPAADRITAGIGRSGPRVVDFAPILKHKDVALNPVVRRLLDRCRAVYDAPVEIEFAVTIEPGSAPTARLGFLQVRPMVVSHDVVEVSEEEWTRDTVVVASTRALGNGVEEGVTDIVYVKPDAFEARHTPRIAGDIAAINEALVHEGRPYVLIGFGRWGSSDPWLGIPVGWGSIAGARVMVEATLPAMDVEASQGAHFFHNIAAFEVRYLTVHHDEQPGVDWAWLDRQEPVGETDLVRHVRTAQPVTVKVDGRSGRGALWRASEDEA
jgi:hypothetical protein